MSLGIAPDLRFKLEYYGSTQHVFNELELEGVAWDEAVLDDKGS